MISGTSAIASFDSEVKGICVDATCTRIIAGPLGNEPPGWFRITPPVKILNCMRYSACSLLVKKRYAICKAKYLYFFFLREIAAVSNASFNLEWMTVMHRRRTRGSFNEIHYMFLPHAFSDKFFSYGR